MRWTSTVRWIAGASLIAAARFAGLLADTLARTADFTSADFLSGLGASGAPAQGTYRLALVAAALAAGLLGAALHLAYPSAALLGYLLAGAALLGTSATLPCDRGCPIPVVESGGGLVNAAHFFITAAAFLLLAMAMLRLASRCPDRFLRRLSLVALCVEVASMAALGVLLLFATHGVLSASVERVVLAGAFGWLVVSGGRLVTTRPAPAPKLRGGGSR